MSEDILELEPPPADVRIPYGRDPHQYGELRLPPGSGPHPVVVYVHGGFWRDRYTLAHAGHICAALTDAGVATWNIEYRRVGNGGGWPATFLDVATAMDHVRSLAQEYALDTARLLTAGHSAGGHLALWLAARHRISPGSLLYSADPLLPHAAASLAGVTDLVMGAERGLGNGAVVDFMGGAPSDVPDRYATGSPFALLPLGCGQLLVHGTEDQSVPYEMSEHYRLAARAAGDEALLLTLNGIGHFEVIDPRADIWPEIRDSILAFAGDRTP